MQKLKKKSRRLLRFVVIAVILILIPSIFLNFTYGLQYSRNKNNEFIGTHEDYADLIITKTVKNSNGAELTLPQKSEEFIFTVIFSTGEEEYKVKIGDKEQTIKSGGTVTLKHGQTAVISGIPAGAAYRIIETQKTGYTVSGSNHTGIIDKNGSKAEFINIAQNTVPTTVQPPPTTTNRPTEVPTTVQPTIPPATNPPTTYPPTTYPPTTYPPATNPPATYPPATNPPTEPTRTPENTIATEHIDDNITPGGSYQDITHPSDNIAYEYTTGATAVPTEHVGDNLVPRGSYQDVTNPTEHIGGNIGPKNQNDNNGNIPQPSGGKKSNPPTGSSPKTGDDEIDPRFWLIILAVSAFILRYLLFFRAKTEADNEL